MGTRYEDQPVEHWAGPETLDPTPGWKPYRLVVAVKILARPTRVRGGDVVPSTWYVPVVSGAGRRYGLPLVAQANSFYLFQYKTGEFLAIAAFFFLMLRPPPKSTLFPYTTLFR